MKKTR